MDFSRQVYQNIWLFLKIKVHKQPYTLETTQIKTNVKSISWNFLFLRIVKLRKEVKLLFVIFDFTIFTIKRRHQLMCIIQRHYKGKAVNCFFIFLTLRTLLFKLAFRKERFYLLKLELNFEKCSNSHFSGWIMNQSFWICWLHLCFKIVCLSFILSFLSVILINHSINCLWKTFSPLRMTMKLPFQHWD